MAKNMYLGVLHDMPDGGRIVFAHTPLMDCSVMGGRGTRVSGHRTAKMRIEAATKQVDNEGKLTDTVPLPIVCTHAQRP